MPLPILMFLLFLLPNLVQSQCDGSTCMECLDGTSCGWAVGLCLDDCDQIADVSCWSQEYFPGKTAEELCQMAADSAADDQLCGSQTSCEDCVAAVLSDGVSTCQWLETEDGSEFCQSGCGLLGCGKDKCSCDFFDVFCNLMKD